MKLQDRRRALSPCRATQPLPTRDGNRIGCSGDEVMNMQAQALQTSCLPFIIQLMGVDATWDVWGLWGGGLFTLGFLVGV
jgi:hypothetical protein